MCVSYSLANRKSRANAQNTVLLKFYDFSNFLLSHFHFVLYSYFSIICESVETLAGFNVSYN
ncbi:hypothetical protein T02_6027 [Trichinella nativa]|uniref:Uncharacterized protein n=1 Tax=Trichinella nativa TaxID=6335 RepID=A0A0V1L5X8_9BILA|nr:hypothetical protein T02_6027 [Trichinella nativa]